MGSPLPSERTGVDYPEGVDRAVAWRMRLQDPEKVLQTAGYAAGSRPATIARLFGVDTETYKAVRRYYESVREHAARRLLADPEAAGELARLPFGRRDVVIAVGDSLTADAVSWAEILFAAIRGSRSKSDPPLLNAGISGDTTVDLLARLGGVLSERPTWTLALIGTNDARRHGSGPAVVPDAYTRRNLELIRRAGADDGQPAWMWITPPPVIERRLAAHPILREQRISYRQAEVAGKARIVRARPEVVVDLWPVFGSDRRPSLLLDDGVHLSVDGQLAVARRVLSALAVNAP